MLDLKATTAEIARINEEKGWYEGTRTFGEDMALLVSEVSEALEAFRERGLKKWLSYTIELEHVKLKGLSAQEVLDLTDSTPTDLRLIGKPEGVASELADTLIRLLDICHRYGIDLAATTEQKIAYNNTRPYRHGGKDL